MARYVAEGASVTLLTCTLGEEGEILVPELAQLAADQADQLGGYRIWELRAAMAALGVSDTRFLGGPGRYRDSGMMGTPANQKPRAFWGADLDEAVGHAVAVVRQIADQVCVMQSGKLVEVADTDTVFESPQQEYTQALLNAIPGATLATSVVEAGSR